MGARRTSLVTAALLLTTALAACSGSGSDTGTTEPEPTASSESPTGSEPVAGCAATEAPVPDGATVGDTADLDGDGEGDQVWLADSGGERLLGVATASGAVFSTTFELGGPQPATAYAQRLDDGTAIILLDGGRSVPLFGVADCAVVPIDNAQGEQYTFDRGFTGHGTGVGCVEGDDGLALTGYLAVVDADAGTAQVDATTIVVDGRAASNGSTTTTEVAADDPLVEAAQSVGCGDAEPVAEPAS